VAQPDEVAGVKAPDRMYLLQPVAVGEPVEVGVPVGVAVMVAEGVSVTVPIVISVSVGVSDSDQVEVGVIVFVGEFPPTSRVAPYAGRPLKT